MRKEQIILSSNLFMNETATKNTIAKINQKEKETSILIINNAEPMYGATSTDGFKSLGFENVQEITLTLSDFTKQKEMVQLADIIVLTGGNPYPLLKALKETNALSFIKEHALIIGVSAGAMVLGKTINHLDEFVPSMNGDGQFKEYVGYDVFSGQNIIPHYKEEGFFPEDKLEELLDFDGRGKYLLINQFDETI